MKNIGIKEVFDLGIALSAEKNNARLFGKILNDALDFTESDAGTIYILDNNELKFNYMITRSKGVDQSADRGEISIPPVPLKRTHVCACCAMDKKLVAIKDIYEDANFDFSGAQKYDSLNDYRTRSMLVMPMLDDNDDCIGVLQLINTTRDGENREYDTDDINVIKALTSFAAITLNNRKLTDEIRDLLQSFVTVMVGAIDTRSPYNANHTKSMAMYGIRFLEWIDANPDCGITIPEKEKDPFIMSIWLHDVGKLLIPLEVMDKATRLGDAERDVMHRISIAILMEKLKGDEAKVDVLKEAKDFILDINSAGFLPDDKLAKLGEITAIKCMDEDGNIIDLLNEDEYKALSIRRGTLTDEERSIIESHVVYTRQMLSGMKFGGLYSGVTDIASSHHEFINGSGYPNHISGDEINVQTRILTVLDIYDALTAEDRPYKPPMPSEKAFAILEDMAKEGKLDGEIVGKFKESKAWEK